MSATNVVYPQIELALDIVELELEIITVEVDAFRSFHQRVQRMDPTASVTSGSNGSIAEAVSAGGLDPDRVKAGYQETILEMDHYDREYDEPLLSHVEAEFGPEVRVVLESNTPIQGIQERLINTAVNRAIEDREQFQQILTDERDSLELVEEQLGTVERKLHYLIGSSDDNDHQEPEYCVQVEQLETLADECQSISETRQETLHSRKASELSGIGETSLIAYLYEDHEYRFPALAEINEVSESIQRAIRSIGQEFSIGSPS